MRDLVAGTTTEPPILEAHGLVLTSKGRRLIDGIDLALAPGRRTVIVGANGAGKSLLLRTLHGLITPDAGRVTWHGRALDRAARDAQAMVFQRPVLLRRSVAANLRFALATRGVPRRFRAARERDALEMARLEHLARRPARLLSGGEQQRLAVARALAVLPEMLLLDEPTASLDPASTQAVEALIDRAHARGVTVVLVTHDTGQARRMGDDLVFLHAGRVVETGPVAEVLADPRTDALRAWTEGRLYLEDPQPSEER